MKSYFLFALLSIFTLNDFNCKNATTPSNKNNNTNTIQTNSQEMDQLPYYQIPDAPATFTAATVAARTIDGLGYRFHWATEGLTKEALAYDPGNENRSIAQLIDHFLGLSTTILNSIKQVPNIRPAKKVEMNFDEKRKATLENLKAASDLLRANPDVSPEAYKIVFQRGEKKSEFPFWNLLNGPIADAIYHTGQIVSYRRSAGNPVDPNVNVFIGKTRE